MVPESRSYAPSWGFPISKGEIFGVYAPLDFHISWLRRGLVLASPSHPPMASRFSFLLQEGNKSCSERADGTCSTPCVFFHTSLFWIREVIHCWRLSLICYQLGPVQSLLSPTANGGSALQTRLTKSLFCCRSNKAKNRSKKKRFSGLLVMQTGCSDLCRESKWNVNFRFFYAAVHVHVINVIHRGIVLEIPVAKLVSLC